MTGFVFLDGRTSVLWGTNFSDGYPHWYPDGYWDFNFNGIPHDRVDHDDGNRKEN